MTLHLVSPHFVGMCRLQENCAGLMVRTVQCKQVNGSESHSLVIRIQMGMVVPTLALPGEPLNQTVLTLTWLNSTPGTAKYNTTKVKRSQMF